MKMTNRLTKGQKIALESVLYDNIDTDIDFENYLSILYKTVKIAIFEDIYESDLKYYVRQLAKKIDNE